MTFQHYSVLLNETIEQLDIKENGIYVDGTLGGGGHASAVLQRLGDGRQADRHRPGCRSD